MTTDSNEQLTVIGTDAQRVSHSGYKHIAFKQDTEVHGVRQKRKRAQLHTGVIPSVNSASHKICAPHKTESNALSDSSDDEDATDDDDGDIAEKKTPNTSRKQKPFNQILLSNFLNKHSSEGEAFDSESEAEDSLGIFFRCGIS